MPVITAALTNKPIALSIGANLVVNGTFQGSASSWTLGSAWVYSNNSIVWTPTGAELVTNGSFTGSATGWTLGQGWAYGSNNMVKSGSGPTDITSLRQSIVWPGATLYRISFTASISNGAKLIATGIPGGSHDFLPVVVGLNTFDVSSNGSATTSNFQLTPILAFAFLGTIDDVSIKVVNSGTTATQSITGMVTGTRYLVSITASGSVGSVTATLAGATVVIAAGTTVQQIITAGAGSTLSLTASSDFNGAVSSVAVTPAISNKALNSASISNKPLNSTSITNK